MDSQFTQTTFYVISESQRTTMFNTYYNGIKRMLRDGCACAGIPNISRNFNYLHCTVLNHV